MVSTKFVNAIGLIMSELNNPNLLYVAAWLTPHDDFTGRERYVLNVRMKQRVESRLSEHEVIFDVLRSRLPAAYLAKISRVAVHNPKDYVPYTFEDVAVLEEDIFV